MKTLNYSILSKIIDDEKFASEIISALNSIVDAELLKPENEISFDLIDECSKAIIEIENKAPENAAYTLLSSKEFYKNSARFGKGLSTALRVALIAAALVASSITVNAAVGTFTGSTIVENIAVAVSEKKEEKKEKEGTTAESTTDLQDTADTSKTTENTTAQSASLTDKSVLISKGGAPSGSGLIACHEYYNSNDEVQCSYTKLSSLGKEITYKQEYTEKVKNSNTAFDESEYKKEHCQNSVCNEETGELHDFSEWTETKAPTCTALGEQQRYCKNCGITQECPIKATGRHKFTIRSIERARADSTDSKNWRSGEGVDGKIRYVCEICGKKENQKISCAKYVVVDRYEFEYDGKVHHPKIIAVLDRNMRVIPKSEYTHFYFDDNGKGKDIYNQYGAYASLNSDYQGIEVGLRYYYIPDTVKLNEILTGNGTIVPVWQKAKFCENVDRQIYEIQYSKSKDFSGAKTVKAYGSATKTVISDVNKGETYYVRIRGVSDFSRYDTIPKGYWSDVRAITVE